MRCTPWPYQDLTFQVVLDDNKSHLNIVIRLLYKGRIIKAGMRIRIDLMRIRIDLMRIRILNNKIESPNFSKHIYSFSLISKLKILLIFKSEPKP